MLLWTPCRDSPDLWPHDVPLYPPPTAWSPSGAAAGLTAGFPDAPRLSHRPTLLSERGGEAQTQAERVRSKRVSAIGGGNRELDRLHSSNHSLQILTLPPQSAVDDGPETDLGGDVGWTNDRSEVRNGFARSRTRRRGSCSWGLCSNRPAVLTPSTISVCSESPDTRPTVPRNRASVPRLRV